MGKRTNRKQLELEASTASSIFFQQMQPSPLVKTYHEKNNMIHSNNKQTSTKFPPKKTTDKLRMVEALGGRSFYPPPKSRRVERPTEPPKPPRTIEAPSASRWSRIGREVDKLRRESSCSISGTDDWAGGLRSCASESSSLESNFEVRKGKGGKGKGKGKMKGWILSREGSISTESASVIGGSLTTSLELPLSVLRSSWKAAVAEASSAHIEVDASRRDGFGRLIIVGSWKQSLLAYQCLMPLFFNSKDPRVEEVEVPSDSQVSQGSRIWRGKMAVRK